MPSSFSLEQNYPNPFNPVTTIKYAILNEAKVTLKVYNLLGHVVKNLVDEVQTVGYKSVQWNSSSVASGVYFYRFEATNMNNPMESFMNVKRMVVLK